MTWKEGDPLPDLAQMREWVREGSKVDWADLTGAFRRENRLFEECFAWRAFITDYYYYQQMRDFD